MYSLTFIFFLTALLGFLCTAALEVVKWPGAIITGICIATAVGINYNIDGKLPQCDSLVLGNGCVTNLAAQGWGQTGGPKFMVDQSDIPSGKLTFKYIDTVFFWDCVWTFLFVELFDSFGTINAIMMRCGFIKPGIDTELTMSRVNRAMLVDGFGLTLGAFIGSNSITCFIESGTGVEAGSKIIYP